MNTPSSIRLYRHSLSGHSHRVELFLSLLSLPFERIDVDLLRGAHKTPEFLARNPFGQVPVLEDSGVTLADSNAILVYLAKRYDASKRWLPEEPLQAARVQQWLSQAAGPLAAGPGAARLVKVFRAPLDHARAVAIADQFLRALDGALGRTPFIAAEEPTIADLSLYAYTAHAPEGGVSLQPYVRVREWLGRIEALSGFVPMCRTPLQET